MKGRVQMFLSIKKLTLKITVAVVSVILITSTIFGIKKCYSKKHKVEDSSTPTSQSEVITEDNNTTNGDKDEETERTEQIAVGNNNQLQNNNIEKKEENNEGEFKSGLQEDIISERNVNTTNSKFLSSNSKQEKDLSEHLPSVLAYFATDELDESSASTLDNTNN